MARNVNQLLKYLISLLNQPTSIGQRARRLGLKMPAAARQIVRQAISRIDRIDRTTPGTTARSSDKAKHAATWTPQRASPEAHMSCIASVIHGLAARFKLAEDYQSAAVLQIDAALYDIERLRADLEASIGLTLAVAGLLPSHRAGLQPVTASGVPPPRRRARVMAGPAARAQSAA
jgi:hypothetical protein